MAKKEIKKENKQKRSYFKDMKAELKKVIWPTPKQLISNTAAVIVFTIIIAVIVFVLDLCFEMLQKNAITPLQEKVQSSYSVDIDSETSSETENNNEQEETEVIDDTNTESVENDTNLDEANDASTENDVEDSENSENE